MQYKVTNKAKDIRKFRDRFLGKDILVKPGKFILTNKPPVENEIWKVENVEELEEKKEQKIGIQLKGGKLKEVKKI